MNERKKEYNPFEKVIGDFLGILQCLLIICDVKGYKNWITDYHSKKIGGSDLPGYKLLFDTLFRMLISDIERSSSLGITSDDIFERASFTGTPVNKLPNSCEKTILIKNLIEQFSYVMSSGDWAELEITMSKFSSEILSPLNSIREVSSTQTGYAIQDLDAAINYSAMFQTYLFLNDTSRGIPHGYMSSMFEEATFGYRNRIAKTLGNSFDGYKYGNQYLWAQLLKNKFQGSVVSNIHKTGSWGAFDGYFDKIQAKIINPLEKSTGATMGYETFIVTTKSPKYYFQKLLEKKPIEIELSPLENLKRIFLWYPIQLIDSSDYSFSGIPTFIPLLMGLIQIKRRSEDKTKAKVIRIVHGGAEEHRRSYSYAILSELSGYISDASGWLLFFDCCDDRGSTSLMFKKVEDLLAKYIEKDFIDATSIRMEKETFLALMKETMGESASSNEE